MGIIFKNGPPQAQPTALKLSPSDHCSLLLCSTHDRFFLLTSPNSVSLLRRSSHNKHKSTVFPLLIGGSTPITGLVPSIPLFHLPSYPLLPQPPDRPNTLPNSDNPWPMHFRSLLFDVHPKMLSHLTKNPPSFSHAHFPLCSPEKPVRSMALRLVALMIVTVRRPAVGK